MDQAIMEWFAPAVADRNSRILEFGCGEGLGVEALRSAGYINVTGIDGDAQKVAAGCARGLNLIHGDVYELLGLEFDFVFSSYALVQAPNLRDVLHVLRSVTRQFIFLVVPVRGPRQGGGDGQHDQRVLPVEAEAFSEIVVGMRAPHKLQNVLREGPELWGIIGGFQDRSQLRLACDQFVKNASVITCAELKQGSLLYVGTAGDPVGGEYTAFFPAFERKTADADPAWNPDIVCDITDSGFPDHSWDVVVCSNVIEHVPDLAAMSRELARIIRPGGHLLIDCPWSYPYHAEPPSFGDYWRISLDGFACLFGSAFAPVMMEQNETSTHALYRRQLR